MKISNSTKWLTKFGLVVTVAGLNTLISFPVLARFYPTYRFFNRGPSYESQDGPSLTERLAENRSFQTFTQILRKANLTSIRLGQDQLTILAPTDEAFAALPPGLLEKLLRPENQELLSKILTYHMIRGDVTENDLASGELKTIQGQTIKINGNSSAQILILNDASAKELPIIARNGVIVTLDRVLLPPGLIPLGYSPIGRPPSDTGNNPGGTTTSTILPPSPVQETSFVCHLGSNGLPTTYAITPRGEVPVIRWYSDYFSGAGYTAERRCQEVTARFQNFYNSGQLNYITSGYMNGQAVVCVASQRGNPCASNRVLFTLKPGSNASETVQRLFESRAGASGPLYESQDDSNSVYIDFKEFLKAKPPEGRAFSNPQPGNSGSSHTEPSHQNDRPFGSPVW